MLRCGDSPHMPARPPQTDKAAEMIERLLLPSDDTLAEHKRLQLRELASLNGTLKDEVGPSRGGHRGPAGKRVPTGWLAGWHQAPAIACESMQTNAGWHPLWGTAGGEEPGGRGGAGLAQR